MKTKTRPPSRSEEIARELREIAGRLTEVADQVIAQAERPDQGASGE